MSGEQPGAKLETIAESGRGLRVEFSLCGDRYGHRIVGFDEAGSTVVLLESIEGELSDGWSRSPVLQGLNINDLRSNDATQEKQRAAMLIGTAGDGHWSLAIRPDLSESARGFIFEVACRVKSMPSKLTSSYAAGESRQWNGSAVGFQLNTELGEYGLQVLPLSDSLSNRSCIANCEARQLQLTAEIGLEITIPATLQWRYGVWMT